MSIRLENGNIATLVHDGHWVDLYLGQPRTGTQPLQSVQLHGSAVFPFTVDDTLDYTVVIRGPAQFTMSFAPD